MCHARYGPRRTTWHLNLNEARLGLSVGALCQWWLSSRYAYAKSFPNNEILSCSARKLSKGRHLFKEMVAPGTASELRGEFCQRWSKGYPQSLQVRQKWITTQRNLKEGDIMILKDDGQPRKLWKLARVAPTYPDEDGYVRVVNFAVADQSWDANCKGVRPRSSISYFERSINGFILLISFNEYKKRGFHAAGEPQEL